MGRNPPGRVFAAQTFMPTGFVAQTVNPPGRLCVSADYHPTIHSSANPPDRFFGANRKPSRALLCVRRLSPYHRLKRKPSRQVFGANCTPSRVQKPSFQKSINPPGTAVCLQTITLKPHDFESANPPTTGFSYFFYANRKPSWEGLCVRRLSPYHRPYGTIDCTST